MFLNLIRMIITLLVFASMTTGVGSIHDPKKLGRIGGKTLLLYLCTTILSISIGLLIAWQFQPGVGFPLSPDQNVTIAEGPALIQSFVALIPKNPIAALVSGNVLQIIVFSIFLGIAINAAGEKGRPLKEAMESLAAVMFRLTNIVMELSPIGVFAISASTIGLHGPEVLKPLLKFISFYYLACGLFVVGVFCPILLAAGIRPLNFFKGMRDAVTVAFSTGSSAATLPVSMRSVQEKIGVSKSIATFVLPLGSTVNMNGTALFQAMAALFIAQAYGIHLDSVAIVQVIVTATFSAIGTAGIPGSGIIMLSTVLSAAGLPLEGVMQLMVIDRLRDMVGTVVNIMGDAVVAVVIAKQEGELDETCSEFILEGSEV
jgi:DAACS family dicarboxylate/amino acid:cation (Na+ or H+) symporter